MSVFAVGADGVLTNVANVSDDATLNLLFPTSVATAEVGGATYLFVAGAGDDGVSVFEVGAGGSLVHVDNATDDATLALDEASSLATAEVGGTTYLFVAGFEDDGVSVFAVGADGVLTNVANVSDDATLNLLFPTSVATATVGGTTYLFVAGLGDDGISVFAVGNDGALTNVANVGDDGTLNLNNVSSVTTAAVGGTTYLFAASPLDNGVSVFEVGNDGSLVNVENVSDDAALHLQAASSVTTAAVGGTTYLFVTSPNESGFSVFAVGADGALTNVANVSDDATLQLFSPTSAAVAEVGGTPYLFAAGNGLADAGISVFELSASGAILGSNGADTLIGTNAADTIEGRAGDDLILGLTGDDTLIGGAGDDQLYGDAGNDTAVFSGSEFDYSFTDLGNGVYQISDLRAGSPDGTDTLYGIENITIAEGTFSLVAGNLDPTDIALSHSTIAENSAAGALVGALSATDPNAGETFTYQLLDDAGGRFALNGNLLEVAGSLDFETATSHQVTVRVTDSGGLTRDETFTIGVTDVVEGSGPTIYTIASLQTEVAEGDGGTTTQLRFVVSRTGDLSSAGSVDYRLGAASTADEFDLASPASGTVSFAAGEATAVLTLDVQGDDLFETTETLTVELANPSSGQVGPAAQVTILNDDNVPLELTFELAGTDPFGIVTTFPDTGYANFNFVDIDADGDLDLYHAENGSFQENIGSADAPAFDAPSVPAQVVGLPFTAAFSYTFADIDGDGDSDLLAGRDVSANSGLSFLRNIGNAFTPAFVSEGSPFDLGATVDALPLSSVTRTLPEFADIDADGDLDLFYGGNDGNLRFYENTGTATAGVWRAPNDTDGSDTLLVNPFGLVNTGILRSAVEFGDVDRDGDLDAVVTGFAGGAPTLVYYENTGGAQSPFFRVSDVNPFAAVDLSALGEDSRPTLADIDGDGDLDLFIHEAQSVSNGGILFYENTTPVLIDGTPGDDVLTGTANDDALRGLGGNDTIDGGVGTDTAVYTGNRTDFEVTDLGGGRYQVSDLRSGAPDGIDEIIGIETLRFADGSFAPADLFNRAPTDLALSNAAVAENSAPGTVVGTLSATDADAGETFTYQLLDDAGGRFALNGANLEVAGGLDFETAASHQVTVRVTDSGGLTYDEIFTIGVTDVADGGIIPPPNTLNGSAGDDTLDGRGGIATLTGGAGDDTFYVDDARAVVVEADGGGTDRVLTFVDYTLAPGSEVEILDAAISSATTPLNLTGNGLANTIIGNAGDNILDGGGGADRLFGNGGNDTYFVDNADDQVFESAGEGIDRVLASVDYTLTAGSHVEILDAANSGSTAWLNLTGNELANTVIGNAGANTINGGAGSDTLFGNGGADTFLFNTALNAASNVDFIGDFNQIDDLIALDDAVFRNLEADPGHFLIGTEFHIGTGAGDADDRIIYDDASGALFYDSDGTGAAAQVQFATLSAGLALVNDDFIVV